MELYTIVRTRFFLDARPTGSRWCWLGPNKSNMGP